MCAVGNYKCTIKGKYLVYLGHRLFYFDFMSQSAIPNQPTFTSFACEDWQTFYNNLAKENTPEKQYKHWFLWPLRKSFFKGTI